MEFITQESLINVKPILLKDVETNQIFSFKKDTTYEIKYLKIAPNRAICITKQGPKGSASLPEFNPSTANFPIEEVYIYEGHFVVTKVIKEKTV